MGAPEKFPFDDPWAGFGQDCLTCHASTADKMATFSALRNVLGIPLIFLRVTPTQPKPPPPHDSVHARLAPHPQPALVTVPLPRRVTAAFATLFSHFQEGPGPETLPPESPDAVVQGPPPHGQKQFLTSDSCFGCHGCHDAIRNLTPVRPNMSFADTAQGQDINLSPYGECTRR